jgi:hypothetical protein
VRKGTGDPVETSRIELLEKLMKKIGLITAILLLSSAWVLAQSSTSPAEQNPSGSSPSAQQPDKSQTGAQTATPDQSAQTIEGCLSGAADTFTLTDDSGKTYQLTGDTSQLNDNVGHRVRISGAAGSTGGGEKITAGGAQATFGVKQVKSLSTTCTSK